MSPYSSDGSVGGGSDGSGVSIDGDSDDGGGGDGGGVTTTVSTWGLISLLTVSIFL